MCDHEDVRDRGNDVFFFFFLGKFHHRDTDALWDVQSAKKSSVHCKEERRFLLLLIHMQIILLCPEHLGGEVAHDPPTHCLLPLFQVFQLQFSKFKSNIGPSSLALWLIRARCPCTQQTAPFSLHAHPSHLAHSCLGLSHIRK